VGSLVETGERTLMSDIEVAAILSCFFALDWRHPSAAIGCLFASAAKAIPRSRFASTWNGAARANERTSRLECQLPVIDYSGVESRCTLGQGSSFPGEGMGCGPPSL
jgi:hypothetical protein